MAAGLDYLKETSSQTVGPYVHIGLAPRAIGLNVFADKATNVLAGPKTKGERIRIEGRVIDGSGTPVCDALLEIWQANAAGRYRHPADLQDSKPVDPTFRGWGRTCTDFASGAYAFDTIKPGSVIGRNGLPMAPHVNFWLVARGINLGLHTRMYFADEGEANAKDPVLNLIEQEVRRKTLLARPSSRTKQVVYTFDIVLQGPEETVFFDV